MAIDVERLREALKQESYGAFFGGGFGGALEEALDIDRASVEELIEMAKEKGIDLNNFLL